MLGGDGQQARVQGIGLGMQAQGLGELARTIGGHPHCRQVRLSEHLQHGMFVAATGFQHDPLAVHPSQTLGQRTLPLWRIGLGPGLLVRQDMNDQLSLGYIDPDMAPHRRSPQ
ncbi:hypothetical protein NG828_21660 [Xanthomonas sacchari]|nr:hypothetical protein [Xanthomonas sacchari]UYK72753.1 hypothetical protein NG828_21660 [Xanthomonas sacchari]